MAIITSTCMYIHYSMPLPFKVSTWLLTLTPVIHKIYSYLRRVISHRWSDLIKEFHILEKKSNLAYLISLWMDYSFHVIMDVGGMAITYTVCRFLSILLHADQFWDLFFIMFIALEDDIKRPHKYCGIACWSTSSSDCINNKDTIRSLHPLKGCFLRFLYIWMISHKLTNFKITTGSPKDAFVNV
jgi:hypothetical protein